MAQFDWNDFLEKNKAVPIPEESFLHVEASLFNGIKPGMLLEVCHKNNPDIYWIAEINMVCGHLLRLKFIGATNDFWCDISSTKVHPLGWCGKYDELIEPPDDINEKFGDKIIDIMKKTLLDGISVSIEALNNKGLSPIDRIKPGMKVEVQSILDPYRYWIATVNENVGGRLLLRYDGADEDLPNFWLFYSSPRLCSFGFVTNKGSPWQFKYPGKVNKFSCKNKLSAQLRLCAEESIKDPTPNDLFQPNFTMEVHNFVVGMKLEALDPSDLKSVCPATVIKVFNNFYFLVVIDGYLEDYEDTKMAWLCDSTHPYIYPIGWAQKNNIAFTSPKIWIEGPFDWDEYLSMTSSVPAPEYCFGAKECIIGINENMKLETVNPKNDDEIHVASVERIVEHMMCLVLLSNREKVWYSGNSDQILPVGWCDSNNYELHVPDLASLKTDATKELETTSKEVEVKPVEEWCDRIFFNYKCYAGPMISRNKLSQLPKHVGPGPLSLVLKEVLNKIISASYTPAKLLRDWETEGPAEDGMRLEMLKAKLKSSTYHAYVPVTTVADQAGNFCRDICSKLQACPYLFGPVEYSEQCLENCQQADKSKFYNGVERRGRPKGSLNGKKKRRRAMAVLNPERTKEQQPQPDTESKDGAESGNESEIGSTPPSDQGTRPNSPDSASEKQRRKQNKNYPKMEMKTRGAKLPNFKLQIKQGHWNKKDVETIYNNSCIPQKKPSLGGSDIEIESTSTNSRDAKNNYISDVSDSEEPELKKLKYIQSQDHDSSDIKMLERDTVLWNKGKLNLSSNPLDWSVDDVYTYLCNTEDCKLIADRMKEEEIDGQAFILLDLAMIKEFLHMRTEYALQLCKHITMIKWYYMVNYDRYGRES